MFDFQFGLCYHYMYLLVRVKCLAQEKYLNTNAISRDYPVISICPLWHPTPIWSTLPLCHPLLLYHQRSKRINIFLFWWAKKIVNSQTILTDNTQVWIFIGILMPQSDQFICSHYSSVQEFTWWIYPILIHFYSLLFCLPIFIPFSS